jgi:hypothetical protein
MQAVMRQGLSHLLPIADSNPPTPPARETMRPQTGTTPGLASLTLP